MNSVALLEPTEAKLDVVETWKSATIAKTWPTQVAKYCNDWLQLLQCAQTLYSSLRWWYCKKVFYNNRDINCTICWSYGGIWSKMCTFTPRLRCASYNDVLLTLIYDVTCASFAKWYLLLFFNYWLRFSTLYLGISRQLLYIMIYSDTIWIFTMISCDHWQIYCCVHVLLITTL